MSSDQNMACTKMMLAGISTLTALGYYTAAMAGPKLQPPAVSLTAGIKLLAHISCDGQAGRNVQAVPCHFAQVGTLAAKLQVGKQQHW